jgi:plastocyanin
MMRLFTAVVLLSLLGGVDTGRCGDRAASAGTGSITGRVVVQGKIPPPVPYTPTKDVQVCGAGTHTSDEVVVGANNGIRYVVVSLVSVSGASPPAARASVTLDQRGCRFQPHVVLIPAGATLEILNSDGILHNIRTTSRRNPPFNKAQPKFVKKLTHVFAAAPEKIKVQCDAHSWMSAWIVVQDHPYYAVTDEQGRFTLTGVPAGAYTVEYWHERLGVQTAAVRVPGGETVTADCIFNPE